MWFPGKGRGGNKNTFLKRRPFRDRGGDSLFPGFLPPRVVKNFLGGRGTTVWVCVNPLYKGGGETPRGIRGNRGWWKPTEDLVGTKSWWGSVCGATNKGGASV